jgi:hypothetical protein
MKFQENGSQRLELIPKKTSQIGLLCVAPSLHLPIDRFLTAGKISPGMARRA